MPTITTAQRDEARATLRTMLKPGATIHTKLNHVSRSGMMRVIDLFVIEEGELRRITWLACRATATTYNEKHEGMRMDGCGMDMGFAAVYNLGRTLWPDGTRNPTARATVSPIGMVDMRSNTGGSNDPPGPFPHPRTLRTRTS